MSVSEKIFSKKDLAKLIFPLMIELAIKLMVEMIASVMVSSVGEVLLQKNRTLYLEKCLTTSRTIRLSEKNFLSVY